jgi:hypothetical protein
MNKRQKQSAERQSKRIRDAAVREYRRMRVTLIEPGTGSGE